MHTSTTLLSSPPPCRPATLTLTPLKTRPSHHPPLLRGMLCLKGSGGKLLIRKDLISQSQGKLNYMWVSGPHSVGTQVWNRPFRGFCGSSMMDSPCHQSIPQLARYNPGWYQGTQRPSWNDEKVSDYMWYQPLSIDCLKGWAHCIWANCAVSSQLPNHGIRPCKIPREVW